jgi:hypothetical protein
MFDFIIVRLDKREGDMLPAWLCRWRGEWATGYTIDEATRFGSEHEAEDWVKEVGLQPSDCSFWRMSLVKVK